MTTPTALIAEDEPLLAQALQAELARAWPELRIVATVGDGASAVDAGAGAQARRAVLRHPHARPERPGRGGGTGRRLAARTQPFPALVFVTAYDQYAVQAFETQAVDYVLKPVQAARLQKTVAKVQDVLARRGQGGARPRGHAGPAAPACCGAVQARRPRRRRR